MQFSSGIGQLVMIQSIDMMLEMQPLIIKLWCSTLLLSIQSLDKFTSFHIKRYAYIECTHTQLQYVQKY